MEIDNKELKKQDGKVVPFKDRDGNIIGTATLTFVDGDLEMEGTSNKDIGHITAVIYKGNISKFEINEPRNS